MDRIPGDIRFDGVEGRIVQVVGKFMDRGDLCPRINQLYGKKVKYQGPVHHRKISANFVIIVTFQYAVGVLAILQIIGIGIININGFNLEVEQITEEDILVKGKIASFSGIY